MGVLGFALRVWSMRVLGRFYTHPRDHRGPVGRPQRPLPSRAPPGLPRIDPRVYRGRDLVRNFLSVAVVVLLAIACTPRIRTEERMLLSALGEPYAEYRRRSWRLLPFVF